MKTSSTCAPSGCGAASSARPRRSTSAPTRLFVAYTAWAEMTCFMVLGWQFPVHIFDLHTAYLAASNILLPYNPDEVKQKPRKRLSDACRAYGIEGWENIDKAGDRQGHRRRPLARIRPGSRPRLLRRGRAQVGAAAARAVAAAAITRPPCCRPPMSSACCTGRITAQGGRADPGARHADRHGACGTWCRRTSRP